MTKKDDSPGLIQPDLFTLLDAVADWPVKDDIHSMEYPIFSLSKNKDLRIRTYQRGDKYVKIIPSVIGAATVFDKDILIYAVSKIVRAVEAGKTPTRRVRFDIHPFLVGTRRSTGGAAYERALVASEGSAATQPMREMLQEARWFIKSLQSRNETLMKVATQIVEHQRGFLEYGDEAMKPLVLHDIAEAVGMHESTISRVTTQKFMHTPRGIYELKYFFSSHVSTSEGGECSSTAIRAIIKKLVAAENQKKPLSDSKIAGLLEAQGIQVARRTVAKYRESLGIAPSSERKRLM